MSASRPDSAATAAADRPAATDLVESDVEAPDVFQRSEAALWDGRPSLGGVWVAHPDVTDPERVIIRNTANGQTVIGALFRRERENPGPRIQVSSDAAAALGLIAGAPTQLDVTALKRNEPKAEEPAPAAQEAVVADAGTAPETDAVAGASAAIARAEAADAEGTTAAPDAEAGGAVVAAAEPEAPRKRGFLAGLFGAKKVAEPLSATGGAAATGTATALDAPSVTTAALDAPAVEATPIATAPAPVIAPAGQADANTEQAFTDPQIVAPGAEPEPRRRGFLGGLFAPRDPAPLSALSPTVTGSAESVLDPQAADGSAPAPATRGSYLEVGVFPSRSTADSAADDMRQAGIIPLIDQRETADDEGWRVLVGPATSREDRAELLHKVKGLGYEDASVVSR